MTRLGAAFWLVLVLTAGFTTFRVKYAVQDVEDELSRVRKQTVAEQQEIRVLTAEWTYLNQPERLAELNRRFLGLTAIATRQLQRSIEDIPLRAPAVPPDLLVEATPGPAAPQTLASGPPIAPAVLDPAPALPAVVRRSDGAQSPNAAPGGEGPRPPADAAPVRLAKAEPTQTANSLDALIAQIADSR